MNNKVQNIVLGVLAVALIGITVAYATLTQQLKINGTATVKAGTLKVLAKMPEKDAGEKEKADSEDSSEDEWIKSLVTDLVYDAAD